jgi:hypothetical protein
MSIRQHADDLIEDFNNGLKTSVVCARCTRPAMFKFKVGAYTYCEECVEKVTGVKP